jgi:hypothetical protein
MELTDVLAFAIPFEFNLDGFITKGEVYKYLPDKPYWDDLKARGIIVEKDAAKLSRELKEGGETDEAKSKALKDIAADPAKVEQVNKVYYAQLAGMLKSWDVTIKGEPVQISIEGVEQVGRILSTFATSLFEYLMEIRHGNFPSGTVSSPGSPETEKTETAPESTLPATDSIAQPSIGTALPSNS